MLVTIFVWIKIVVLVQDPTYKAFISLVVFLTADKTASDYNIRSISIPEKFVAENSDAWSQPVIILANLNNFPEDTNQCFSLLHLFHVLTKQQNHRCK